MNKSPFPDCVRFAWTTPNPMMDESLYRNALSFYKIFFIYIILFHIDSPHPLNACATVFNYCLACCQNGIATVSYFLGDKSKPPKKVILFNRLH